MGYTHKVTVIVEGAQIGGWSGYHVESSMITPADSFELRRPFESRAWNLLRIDARVSIKIDDVTIVDGFIDKRSMSSDAGTMSISGRDKVGRLSDESAPRIEYTGMSILAAVEELVSPWFSHVTISDARNRTLRRGKGRRVAGGAEPVVTIAIRVPRRGTVHPGQTRWQVIHEIASRAGLIAYSSADGTEFFIGKPNHTQPPQFVFAKAKRGSALKSTVRDMTVTEDSGDRFSLYLCSGVGGQSDTNYGANVTDNRGVVFDNPFNRLDGTGRDFIRPKRMHLPEREFESHGDAQRVAANEQARRDFKRHEISVSVSNHGQFISRDNITLFAPNTVARVINQDFDPPLDDKYIIVSCAYSDNRDQGGQTTIHMVPTGTEIIL